MYILNEEKMFFDIAEGQAVVINYKTGMYYGSSELGSLILEALVQGIDENVILKTIEEKDNCPENFKAQFDEFLSQILEKEILIKTEKDNNDKSFELNTVIDDFSLALNEYAEVQDLLLADPVHDVDADMGWPILKDDMS